MREARNGEHVLQLRRQPGVRVRIVIQVNHGLLARLGTQKGGPVRSLVPTQRNETEFREFILPSIRNGDLRRNLYLDIALIRGKSMRRQAFYQTPAFNASDGRAPFMFRESIR